MIIAAYGAVLAVYLLGSVAGWSRLRQVMAGLALPVGAAVRLLYGLPVRPGKGS